MPLLAEGELHFARQDGERLLKIVPVRRRPAAGWDMHVDQAVLAAGLLARKQHGVGITDETEVDLAGIVRVNHPKLACEIIWRKDGTLHGWDRLTSPGQIQTRSKDLASPTPQHGPSSRRQLVHQPRSNRGGASP